jgi:hypothetical protein
MMIWSATGDARSASGPEDVWILEVLPMRSTAIFCALLLATAACGKKGDSDSSKTVEQKTPDTPPPPPTCAKGQVADNGKCVPLPVTPDKIAAVKQTADKLAEIDELLAKVDTVSAPIELLNAFRQLDAWKKMAATNDKFADAEKIVVTLDTAAKQLRAFRTQVAASRTQLTDLSATLQKAYDDSGAGKTLADLRTQISSEVKAAIAPLETQVTATVQNAITPTLIELTKVSDLLEAGCAILKVSGGSPESKELCAKSKDVFAQALTYVKSLEGKPVTFFTDLTTQLDTQLADLVDAEVKSLLTDADARLKKALTAPAQPPAPPPGP